MRMIRESGMLETAETATRAQTIATSAGSHTQMLQDRYRAERFRLPQAYTLHPSISGSCSATRRCRRAHLEVVNARYQQPVLRRFWYPIMPMSHVGKDPVLSSCWVRTSLSGRRPMAASPACRPLLSSKRKPRLAISKTATSWLPWLAYAADGVCVKVPQQPAMPIPERRRVPSYRTAEKYGYLWVAPLSLTDMPSFRASTPGFRQVHEFYETWNIGALRLMENFLDSAHVAYVHQRPSATLPVRSGAREIDRISGL